MITTGWWTERWGEGVVCRVGKGGAMSSRGRAVVTELTEAGLSSAWDHWKGLGLGPGLCGPWGWYWPRDPAEDTRTLGEARGLKPVPKPSSPRNMNSLRPSTSTGDSVKSMMALVSMLLRLLGGYLFFLTGFVGSWILIPLRMGLGRGGEGCLGLWGPLKVGKDDLGALAGAWARGAPGRGSGCLSCGIFWGLKNQH